MSGQNDGSPPKKTYNISVQGVKSTNLNLDDPNSLLNMRENSATNPHSQNQSNQQHATRNDGAQYRNEQSEESRRHSQENQMRGNASNSENRTRFCDDSQRGRQREDMPENSGNTHPGNDPNGDNNSDGSGSPNSEHSDEGEFSGLPTEDEVEAEANAPCAWPLSVFKVARCERPKFFRMAGMFFLIAYVYSVLRDTKDAVVMERQEPASIAFLKTLYVTPLSFCCIFLLSKLLGAHSVGTVLKGATIVFGTYFVAYAGVLLPLQERVEPSVFWAKGVFGDGKMAVRGLQPVLALFLTANFWTSSLLYVTSELWGNIVLSLLFMAFANDVCAFRQSLRFVPLFYVVSNLGLFLSGLSMLGLCAIQKNASYTVRRLAINAVFAAGGAACAGILALQRSLEGILAKPIVRPTTSESGSRSRARPRRKVGLAEGLATMVKSPLLLRACGVVLCYNACTNVVDTAFKSAMKAHAVAANEAVAAAVMRTQAINQIAISAAVIALLMTPFARAVQIVGWRMAGLVTPAWAMACGACVLSLAAYNTATAGTNQLGLANSALRNSPDLLWAERLCGMVAAGGLKTAKYAAFDIALEALSMRIAKDDRATAKGIYAGICGKLGKTFGSILTITVLGITNAIDIRSAAQYCLVAVALMVSVWVYAVGYLANAYNDSVKSGREIELGTAAQKEKKIETEKLETKKIDSNLKEHAVTIK